MHVAKGYLSLAVALLMVVAACTRETPEQRLRASVASLQDAIETRDPGGVEDSLADDFIGPDGLDREGARRLAQIVFMRYRDVGVHQGPLDVRIQGEHATVAFTAVVTGGSGGLLPEQGRVHAVKTGWRLVEGEWLMTSAQWDAESR